MARLSKAKVASFAPKFKTEVLQRAAVIIRLEFDILEQRAIATQTALPAES
jgi:hypothetical protein